MLRGTCAALGCSVRFRLGTLEYGLDDSLMRTGNTVVTFISTGDAIPRVRPGANGDTN